MICALFTRACVSASKFAFFSIFGHTFSRRSPLLPFALTSAKVIKGYVSVSCFCLNSFFCPLFWSAVKFFRSTVPNCTAPHALIIYPQCTSFLCKSFSSYYVSSKNAEHRAHNQKIRLLQPLFRTAFPLLFQTERMFSKHIIRQVFKAFSLSPFTRMLHFYKYSQI